MTGQRFNRRSSSREVRRRYVPKRKVCFFCVTRGEEIDYKNPVKLRSYMSGRGKIQPPRKTGVCAKHQRLLAVAIKRARHLALLPYAPIHMYQTVGVGIRD